MHKALRTFNYPQLDGTMTMAKIGDALPGAHTWRNVEKLVRRYWITDINGELWVDTRWRKALPTPPAAVVAVKVETPKKETPKPKVSASKQNRPSHTEKSLNQLAKADVQFIASTFELDMDGMKGTLIEAILDAQTAREAGNG